MATSRPLREGDLIVCCAPTQSCGTWAHFVHHLSGEPWFLAADFGVSNGGDLLKISERMFGISDGFRPTRAGLIAAITNGTAPGLYVREGDDTSNWEVYREVLARRVEEAMAARRGGASGGEATATRPSSPQFGQTIGVLSDGMEVTLDPVTGHIVPTTTRQDDEIRVGDVVEVVSCIDTRFTRDGDIGSGGRITLLGNLSMQITCVEGMRPPSVGIAAIADVRKVSSPLPSPQTVAANISPMPDPEVVRIATPEEVRSHMTARGHIVNNPSQPTDARASINFVDVVVVPAAEAYRRLATDDRRLSNVPQSSSRPAPQLSSPQPPPQLSRFSLLEVDVDTDVSPAPAPQALKAPVDLAALQQELRAEREAKRALAAAQTPPGRFDLLECDLPAIPATAAVTPTKASRPQRPAASSPPPRRPVETITDLTAARSPLELARMLEGLNDELSTMLRQREAN